jgi:hypothetical protein
MQTAEGLRRPESGLCFGSRFLGGDGIRLLEILPGTSFERVRNRKNFWLAWLVDICSEHVDNRQAVFVENADGSLDASFFDMGHMFGGPNADQAKHFRTSRYLDPRIYPEVTSEEPLDFRSAVSALDTDKLWHKVQAIPADWSRTSALDCFVRCLQTLSDQRLVQNVLETILDAHRRGAERESGDHRWEHNVPGSVLRAGVQGAELEWFRTGTLVHYPACA